VGLEHARQHAEPGSPFQSHDLHELVLTERGFHPTSISPRHLRDTPQLPEEPKQGLWQLDLDMEHVADHSWMQNVQHR
jgi:hypothetical protein